MPPRKILPKKPQQSASTSSSTSASLRRSRNPAVCFDPSVIDSIDDDVPPQTAKLVQKRKDSIDEDFSAQIVQLIQDGKELEEIFEFHVKKKPLSEEQRNMWIEKFNQFRAEQFQAEEQYKCTSPEEYSLDIASSGSSEEELDGFIDKLIKKHKWLDVVESSSEEQISSDCSSGDEGQKSLLRPKRPGGSRTFSWKEFKANLQLGKILSRKPKVPDVNNLVKLTVKEIFKQKKKAEKLAEEKEKDIKVEREEVFNMFSRVIDRITKRYLEKIRWTTPRVDPCDKLSKTITSDHELLMKSGLYNVILLALPFYFDLTDETKVNEFIEILKDTKDKITKEPVQEDFVEDAEISDRLSRTLKSEGSEKSKDTSGFVFPDTYKAEHETLDSPEDLSDVHMSEASGTDLPPEHLATSASSDLQRRGSRRRSPSLSQPGRSPAKRKN